MVVWLTLDLLVSYLFCQHLLICFPPRYLYNDSSYLAEKLGDFASSWKARDDLTPRAQNMLRIENDIKALQGFANRAYSNEMNTQKTIVKDLLGGKSRPSEHKISNMDSLCAY